MSMYTLMISVLLGFDYKIESNIVLPFSMCPALNSNWAYLEIKVI